MTGTHHELPVTRDPLRELFDELLELDPAERQARLGERLPAGPLRARLEAMLEAEQSQSPLFDRPVTLAIEQLLEPRDFIGSSIGPFLIRDVIGEGGSSIVFRAERGAGAGVQTVALKLMRGGLFSSEGQRRFQREQAILAQLTHPNITRLVEAGITETGVPYIAMELVDGPPVTEHAARQALDLDARLACFIAVCRAVEAAHAALVVHRDLKPSNVLVDSHGEVKVLDFGIARLLDDDDPARTRTQTIVLTPEYAAPEQFRPGPVTIAADIHALGVLLGELLTGVRPDDIVRRDGLSGQLAALPEHHPPRGLPERELLQRALRGDLDAIVTTAIAEAPEDRYRSAGALADDIQRHLDGLPVAAHPPTRWYRTVKFVRRHRGSVLATAALVLGIISALGMALWQARVAHVQAGIARAQVSRAEAVQRFLVGVFEYASPDESGGRPITAQELLDMGEKRIDGSVREQPALEADVLMLLGKLYIEIGELGKARGVFERAFAASEREGVPRDVRIRALTGMARIDVETNATDAAIGYARQALALLESEPSPNPEEVAHAHELMARAMIDRGSLAEVEPMLRANIASDEAALGRDHSDVAYQWLMLGRLLDGLGHYDQAGPAFLNAIEGFRASFGENSNRVAHAFNEYANMLAKSGDLAGAEAAYRRALAIRAATVGPDHRNTLAITGNLIYIVEQQDRYAEALPQRIALLERLHAVGSVQPQVLFAQHISIGRDYRELGRFEEAQAQLREALDIATQLQGPRGAWRAIVLSHLSRTLALSGDFDEAETCAREAVSIATESEGDSPQAALYRAQLGSVLLLRQRHAEALSEAGRSAASFKPAVSATHQNRPTVLAVLSQAQLANGDATLALSTGRDAVDLARSAFPSGSSLLGAPLFALAEAHLALGHGGEAEQALREALDVRHPPYPAADPRILEVKVALSLALRMQGRVREADALRDEIRPLLRASSPYLRALEARLDAGS